MGRTLNMHTGREQLTFCDEQGRELAVVWWNPGDPGLAARAEQAVAQLQERWGDREPKDGKEMLMLERQVKTLFDEMFDCELSATLFAHISPMALMKDGSYFYEQLLQSLLPLVEDAVEERGRKSRERVKRYTDAAGK